MRAKHSAPGQYMGYTLQDVRLGFRLMDAPPGCQVSIEHLDDIAVHYPGGELLLEQDKSAKEGNPLSDSSPELWKTLANWALDCPLPCTGRRFQLYVTPTAKIGALAAKIDSASSNQDADAIIKWAADKLKGKAGDALKEQLARFSSADTDKQRCVIINASVVSEDADPLAPMRKILGSALSGPLKEICCRHIIGSAQSAAREKLLASQPAVLDADVFKAEIQAFVRRTNMQRLLQNAAKPSEGEVQGKMAEQPVFVRQLTLIEVADDARLRAVADFLQASASKTLWASTGLVLEDAFDAWDRALLYRHGALRDVLVDTQTSMSPEARGRTLYAQCRNITEKLDMHEVQHEFLHGSLNDLADRRALGWHEDYTSLIGDD